MANKKTTTDDLTRMIKSGFDGVDKDFKKELEQRVTLLERKIGLVRRWSNLKDYVTLYSRYKNHHQSV